MDARRWNREAEVETVPPECDHWSHKILVLLGIAYGAAITFAVFLAKAAARADRRSAAARADRRSAATFVEQTTPSKKALTQTVRMRSRQTSVTDGERRKVG